MDPKRSNENTYDAFRSYVHDQIAVNDNDKLTVEEFSATSDRSTKRHIWIRLLNVAGDIRDIRSKVERFRRGSTLTEQFNPNSRATDYSVCINLKAPSPRRKRKHGKRAHSESESESESDGDGSDSDNYSGDYRDDCSSDDSGDDRDDRGDSDNDSDSDSDSDDVYALPIDRHIAVVERGRPRLQRLYMLTTCLFASIGATAVLTDAADWQWATRIFV